MKVNNILKSLTLFSALLLLLSFASCGGEKESPPPRGWAYSSSSGFISYFRSTAADSSGNIYAVGYITENDPYTFAGSNGLTETVTGSCTADNAVIVKYMP